MDEIKQRIARTFTPNRFFSWFPILLLVFALYLVYQVIAPFLNTAILATVLAAIFHPVFLRVRGSFGNRDLPAAVVVVLLIIFLILIPTFLFLTAMVGQGVESLAALSKWVAKTDFNQLITSYNLDPAFAWINEKLPFVDLTKLDISAAVVDASRNFGQLLIRWTTGLLGNLAGLVIQFFIMILILFYFLKDGRHMVAKIRYLMPLRMDQSHAIIHSLRKVSYSVLVGGLLVAVLQGFVGGIALYFVGVPALFWGTMMGFASLVPVLGTGLIWVPVSVYLLIMAKWQAALFLALWCLVIVTSIDTFLRPIFMREASGLPTFFIFLAVIGGVQAFGPLGILYGPLILSFVMAMLAIYSQDYSDILARDNPQPACDARDGRNRPDEST